eukprot:TRINITY_DN5961_c0_g2_i1.p2 TRINITY_DN5961_c0_g2~~TRINITY_DN5961_c0_g2_i1.p2  ORF type:complete len:203 (-),score=56.14 TRINITY_DN5961_c0_g2_i1:205-813(-)
MELARGGDLFDRLVHGGTYSEQDACKLVCVLVRAVRGLHQQGIAHGDLKPENILLRSKHSDLDVCLADFGAATGFDAGSSTGMVGCAERGTLGYLAPEALCGARGEYDAFKADVFALGVILYIVLCGYPPWELHLRPRARPAQLSFEGHQSSTKLWAGVSQGTKQLLQQMLHPDPDARISLDEVLAFIAPVTHTTQPNQAAG